MSGEIAGSAPEPTSPGSEKAEHHPSTTEARPASAADLFSNPNSETRSSKEPSALDEPQTVLNAAPAVEGSEAHPAEPPVPSDVTVSSHDGSLFESTSVYDFFSAMLCLTHILSPLHSEEQSANQPDSVSAQVPDSKPQAKSLQAASAEPTIIIETQGASQVGEPTVLEINGHSDHATEGEHPSEPSAAADAVAVKHENGPERIPSPNRLSISYASGNRRLVIDSDVVTSLKLFRQGAKIEVAIELSKAEDGLKGVLVSTFTFSTCPFLMHLLG